VTKNLIIGSLVVLFGLIGGAQSQQPPVTVIGSVTPGHRTSFASTLQLQDAGAACGGSGVSVTSVFGRTGVVVAQPNDYTLSQIAPGTIAATGGTIGSTAITGGTITNSGITGGNIDGTIIGGTTRAAGSFTTVAISTPLPVASGGTGDAGTAWATYTPSPSCGTATFTVASTRFKTLGKTAWLQEDLTINALGTCTNSVNLNLPVVNNSALLIPALVLSGTATVSFCDAGGPGSVMNCFKNLLANFAASDRIIISGVYESQ
jgi:hypothetical protein